MDWLKEELQFSRIEILGLLGIIAIGMLGIIIQYIPSQEGEMYDLQLADIMQQEEIVEFTKPAVKKFTPKKDFKKIYSYTTSKKPDKKTNWKPKEVFDFDPNAVSKDDLIRLGFKKFLAERWIKFRTAGKEFRDVEDVLSIYGIDTSLVKGLAKHLKFPQEKDMFLENKKGIDENTSKTFALSVTQTDDKESKNEKRNEFKSAKATTIYDLNTSTKEELQKIRGIGPKYAARIIKYRSILGGYSNKEQLQEVYGMTDSTFVLIKDQLDILSPPEKIRINTASQEQLSEHYLMSYKMSKLIYVYREEHGSFVDVEDFKAIKGIEEEEIEKIIPYLDFAM